MIFWFPYVLHLLTWTDICHNGNIMDILRVVVTASLGGVRLDKENR